MNPPADSGARARLDAIVKAYDVRGIVGDGLTEDVVEALGAAFVDEVGAAGGRMIVGHDMRDSSPGFADLVDEGGAERLDHVVGQAVAHDPAHVVGLHDGVEARASAGGGGWIHAVNPTSPRLTWRTTCHPRGADVRSACRAQRS